MESLAVNPVISDSARRFRDIVNGYVVSWDRDELIHKWIAVRLADGGTDGVLYDSKRLAVYHQLDEFLCAYVSFKNLQSGISLGEAEIFLRFNREAYDRGFRLPDPDARDGGREVLMTTAQHDYQRNRLNNEFWDRNRDLWKRWADNARRS
jgi:hypothetical protein